LKTIEVGDFAPDFTLKDQTGKDISLGSYKGKKIVIAFHPLAWTKVCAEQMRDLEKNAKRFEELGAVALGISVDSSFCKKAWAESLGIKLTRLLADFWPHGKVAGDYGIFREGDGFSERAVFVVDAAGRIAFKRIYPISELPDIDEIIKEVSKI